MELRRRKQKKKKLIDHDSGDGRRRGVSGGAPPQNNGLPETVIYSAPQDQYHPPHQHMYPMAPSPPCQHMDEPHPPDEVLENSEALYTMSFKHQRELKRKQQRVCGYVIQLCGPLRMFFDEAVSALYDVKFVLRLIHFCKSVKRSSKLKTPLLCIGKPATVHCSSKSTSHQNRQNKIYLKDDCRYQ
ncbi:unnamed protein product [Brassica rapa subsp. trilocularis]